MPRKDTLLTLQSDLDETRRVFRKLRKYVANEPELIEFVSVTAELDEQAQLLQSGSADIPPLRATSPPRLPNRYFAERVASIIRELPPVGYDFPSDLQLGLAKLLENLVVGVTGAIFLEFPELMREEN